MIIRILHAKTGQVYTFPVSQASVHNDLGEPIAVSFEHQNLIIHSDIRESDFLAVCDKQGVKKI